MGTPVRPVARSKDARCGMAAPLFFCLGSRVKLKRFPAKNAHQSSGTPPPASAQPPPKKRKAARNARCGRWAMGKFSLCRSARHSKITSLKNTGSNKTRSVIFPLTAKNQMTKSDQIKLPCSLFKQRTEANH